ncbi:MAG TPA: adenylate/guanylate cyclase domain-containing protein [Actinomycetota bacterium]|nr:adenylate/guanylate cyclase domain-containing protein [Actinomycetota bacterium]
MQRRTVGRGLGAVLFTDIVGSTAIAAEMGNTRWSALVSRHHQLIRRELRRFGGREQDTAGDGFFATFERPVDAIRCAASSVEGVRALGIEIRVGISFGQLELVEGKAGGLIVNTAARVMSVAGAGEVLVPAAVKDLVPGTGISFDDHGTHSLKGIEGELRLYRVTEVDGRSLPEPADTEEAAERRRAVMPAGSRRAGLVAGGLAAAVVALVVVIWTLAGNDPSEPREPALPSRYVVELDADTGDELQRIPYPDPGRPELARLGTAIAAGQGGIWIEDPTAYAPTVLRVDPRHGEMRRVVVRTSLGTFNLAIDTAFDAVWVATDQLIRINPATEEVRPVARIPLPVGGSGTSSLAVDRRHLWVATSPGELLRIDPNGEVTARRSITDGIQEIATGEGGVWVADQLAGMILRIDPGTLATLAEIPFSGNVDAMEVFDGELWALDFRTGVLRRISIREDRELEQVDVPSDATALAVGLDAIWVTYEDGTVMKVDPVTNQASTFATVEGSARAIAVDEVRESVWVDVRRS